VDRAGADYDKETVVGVSVLDDGDGFIAAGEDGGAGKGGLGRSLAGRVEEGWRGGN